MEISMKRFLILFLLFVCVSLSLSPLFIKSATIKDNQNANHMKPLSSDEVLFTAQGTGETAYYYETIEELTESSDYVVYGEVTDFTFNVKNTIIYTLENVRVIEPLFGNVNAGTQISVHKMGGYILARDFIDSHDTYEERVGERNGRLFKNVSDEEINTKYIGQIPEGYFSPDIGERSVFFLKKKKNSENTYGLTGGCEQGEFIEITDGVLRYPGVENELSQFENHTTVTYEELKEQILEAAGKLQEN